MVNFEVKVLQLCVSCYLLTFTVSLYTLILHLTMSDVVCACSQWMASLRMCEGTSRKMGDRRCYLGCRLGFLSFSSWLCAVSFGRQKQLTVDAKLFLGTNATMVILNSFHKNLYSGPLAGSTAAQLFRKCIVPFPVWQKPGLRVVVANVLGWDGFHRLLPVGNINDKY